jgi:protein-disulfide isomerase
MRSFPILAAMLITACNPEPTAEASPPAETDKEGKSETTWKAYEFDIESDGTPDDKVIATWDGGQMTMGELRTESSEQLAQLEAQYIAERREAETTFLTSRYQVQADTMDAFVTDILLQKEAEKLGYADTDALVADKIIPLVAEPTEAQIQEFYLAYQRQLRGAALEDVRDLIVDQLRQQNAQTVISFPQLPRVPVDVDDDPFLGTSGAPVEIVIFAEYQCPYCATVTPTMEQLITEYPGKLQVVYRDFPLSFHDRAIPAAIAANCAGEQEKYWEMHNILMGNQRALTDENFMTWASQLSLDTGKFTSCLSDPAQAAEVDADFKDGVTAGVNGTPSIYVNGMKASPSHAALAELIERELSEG